MYSQVLLAVDLPKDNVRKGDIAVVLEYLESKTTSEPGYCLEVFNESGDTLAVVIVTESQIQELNQV